MSLVSRLSFSGWKAKVTGKKCVHRSFSIYLTHAIDLFPTQEAIHVYQWIAISTFSAWITMATGLTNPENLQLLTLMTEVTKSVTQGKPCMSRMSLSVSWPQIEILLPFIKIYVIKELSTSFWRKIKVTLHLLKTTQSWDFFLQYAVALKREMLRYFERFKTEQICMQGAKYTIRQIFLWVLLAIEKFKKTFLAL